MDLTLRQSLFRLLFWSIVVTAVVILVNVWTSTAKMVDEQLANRLVVANNVFERVLENRSEILSSSATVLAGDFGFRGVVADVAKGGDTATLNSNLRSNARRIDADVMALLDINGFVKTSEPSIFTSGSLFEFEDAVNALLEDNNENTEAIGIVNGSLYQMILVPVRAPTIKGILIVGFEIDGSFLTDLSNIIQADLIAYQAGRALTDTPVKSLIATSLTKESANKLLGRAQSEVNWIDVTLEGDKPYVLRSLTLTDDAESNVNIAIAANVGPQYKSFTRLQVSILTISVIAMFASLGVSLLVSRRITEPLSSLIEGVKRIAAGDYGKSLDVSGRLQEIRHLASAFSTMQESIASREKRIRYQAQHDDLTGLYNRTHIQTLIGEKLESGEHIQVIGLNIVGFRQINDLYGYVNGDICLQRISERLTRWPGEASRLSGSDMIWIPESPLDEIKLETLKYILEQPVETEELSIPIKVSLGIMDLPDDADNAELLFRRMNIVIDAAKNESSWLARYSDNIESRYLRRLDIITELKRALISEQSELSMVYQPKIDLRSNTVKGLEALIRWNSKELGFVPPDEFIGIAEQAGLIEIVTEWVINQVIVDTSTLREAGHPVSIAINLSTQDVENSALLGRFFEKLEQFELNSSDVQIEVTESDLVADQNLAIQNLDALRERGFKVAIDDFGTGYSSLAYLKDLPVDVIKIDKSFVLNLSKSIEDQQIVNTVLKLADSFNLEVVAEGVEDEVALSLLSEWGCHYAQGYFISRPLPLPDLLKWFEQTPYC
ncbi:EAL domain-containing protein [Alteromonas sediminis]|uniref:EAL domain-containing protein n=1 Tax=Alteromonas sediminis TaxID=2259342 RepID=A0A3N5Y1Q5_9ALTE|nr:EAL domain-containing protein [Alteromonas sediminis]RPJ67622.1 EAL domain-containing protein [Alteromonas sediminis]